MSESQKITKLKLLMQRKKITQWQLAKACDLQQPQVSLICNGFLGNVNPAILAKIADYLGFTDEPEILLEDVGDMA